MFKVAPEAPTPIRRQRLERVSVEPPGIRGFASVVPSTSRETTTFVHDPRRSARPGDKRRSSSNPGFAASARGARNSPADGTNLPKKNLRCVTTRRRNWLPLRRFGCRLGLAAARPLGRGVLGFYGLVPSPVRLPSRSLPPANFAPACRILTVPLVPSPGDVPPSTPFAQAHPRPGSSDSGMTAAFCFIVVRAHRERVFLPREVRGECLRRSLRALIKTGTTQRV
jgi:hypothetical protein